MRNPDLMICSGIAALLLLRLVAIAVTPLGLDVEEAQYWLWSTTPDAGYFSKPPMIAWVIGLGTTFFGDIGFGVRDMAPVMQALTTLLVWRLGQEAFSRAAGRLAALIWVTLPASALGGFIISTDSPMIVFMLAALVMLAPLSRGRHLTSMASVMAGVFTGLAMMSKYAAIYLPLGLEIWWGWQGRHQGLVTWPHLL